MTAVVYTANLTSGTGMIDETVSLLEVWHEGMTSRELDQTVLDAGIFPTMSARRIRNIVVEVFAHRYLVQSGNPALWIKQLKSSLNRSEFSQLLFVYTCRANSILADFVREVYWAYYSAGKSEIEQQDAVDFVVRANQDGKTASPWSDSTIKRNSSYLITCCANFGLLEAGSRKSSRRIMPFNVQRTVSLFLMHELRYSFSLGDNSIANHPDWQLFGLEASDVKEQLRTHMLDGHLVVQSAGGVVNVSWNYKNMQDLINALS